MEFRVLGPVEVTEGGRRLEVGPRMQRMLLAVLLADANRVVSVDRLVDALWGEDPPATAMNGLQGYIAMLRRLLEPDRPARKPPEVLVTQAPGYVLRVPAEGLDAARFEALAGEGRGELAAGRPQEARDRLEPALALWRGGAYADLAYGEALQAEIARLEELRATAGEDLAEARLALGEHAGVVVELERLASAEPLRERRWELLMLALYRSGRQAEALRAFTQARATLNDQLGIDPGPSLRDLERAILDHAPSLDWQPPAVERAAPPPPQAPAAPAPPGTVLVGREEELRVLAARLDEAAARHGQVVLVSGEPGIGKTRLVEEVAGQAGGRGATVAWGRCVEGDAPAFWPWAQVVRAVSAAMGRDATAAALGPGAVHVAQIVPELAEMHRRTDLPLALDLETARMRLFDAVAGFLVRLAEQRPLLVVLDDLQWADLPSVRLLEYLAGRIASAPVAVVVTFRDVEVALDHPLTAALGALARAPTVSRLALPGLTPSALADLAGLDATVAADLHRRTEGNPFFVVELLRLLGDHDLLRTAIPSGVRDVVRHRLARLSDATTSLLAVAAAVGRDFDLDVLAAASGLRGPDEEALVEQIEEAMASALVVEHPEQPGVLRFSHDLVRETLYERLTAVRKARLHRRTGEALEALGRTEGSAHVSAIADHFWRGVPAGTTDKAFDYALRAAEHDTRSLAYEQAEEHLRRALSLLDRLPPAERARRELAAQAMLGLVLLMARGYSAAETGRAAARTVELGREVGDAMTELVATWRLLSFHVLRAEYESTHRLASSLLSHEAAPRIPAFAVTGHRALGVVAVSRGELHEARHHLEAAVALADADADRASAVRVPFEVHPAVFARDFLAVDLWLLGEGARAAQIMEDALAMARALDDPFTAAFSLYLAATIGVLEGDRDQARGHADEAIAVATKHGYVLHAVTAAVIRAWADGDPHEMKQALARTEAAGATQWRHFVLALLGQLLARRGRPRTALAAIDRALASAAETGERFYEPEALRLRAEIHLAASGDASRAEGWLQQAVALARDQGSAVFLARAEADLGRLVAGRR